MSRTVLYSVTSIHRSLTLVRPDKQRFLLGGDIPASTWRCLRRRPSVSLFEGPVAVVWVVSAKYTHLDSSKFHNVREKFKTEGVRDVWGNYTRYLLLKFSVIVFLTYNGVSYFWTFRTLNITNFGPESLNSIGPTVRVSPARVTTGPDFSRRPRRLKSRIVIVWTQRNLVFNDFVGLRFLREN